MPTIAVGMCYYNHFVTQTNQILWQCKNVGFYSSQVGIEEVWDYAGKKRKYIIDYYEINNL